MIRPSSLITRTRGAAGAARARLRGRLLAIVQTAAAAVVAWELAVLMLPDPRPAFASIAAVIAIGATHGERFAAALVDRLQVPAHHAVEQAPAAVHRVHPDSGFACP